MDIAARFRTWLRNGALQARSVGQRGQKRPADALPADSVTKLKNERRTQTQLRPGEALVEAAKCRQTEHGGAVRTIKMQLTYNFFMQLTPEEQDQVCPCRPGR